jgi:phage/plasmid-associated DNA primase
MSTFSSITACDSRMIRKKFNPIDEVGPFDRNAIGIFKWLIGGKTIQVDKKNKTPRDANFTALVSVCCNAPPHIPDPTDGMWRRMLIVPWRVKVKGKRDIGRDDPEWWYKNVNMASVLNWSLAGLKQLIANNYEFTHSALVDAAKEAFKEEGNSALRWLKENCVATKRGRIKAEDLYREYSEHCLRTNRHRVGDTAFGREVTRVFPGSESKPIREVGSAQARYRIGVRKQPVGIAFTWGYAIDVLNKAHEAGVPGLLDPETTECVNRYTGEHFGWADELVKPPHPPRTGTPFAETGLKPTFEGQQIGAGQTAAVTTQGVVVVVGAEAKPISSP